MFIEYNQGCCEIINFTIDRNNDKYIVLSF